MSIQYTDKPGCGVLYECFDALGVGSGFLAWVHVQERVDIIARVGQGCPHALYDACTWARRSCHGWCVGVFAAHQALNQDCELVTNATGPSGIEGGA